ncbi:MotA/TolQ/ExbB proton channel family protein [Desulfurivibrio dismutans]|uniref:MotA/TolQ/ExbB proton channel family protein n=1 Tax=Desulfurivibrio dismutans TaxID=1398908 RepID=UPI0023DAC71E|nr:MotA/TolQ/ExbB proton channel family protein [Desulfurivibrio alkaliphilus]MDF1613725.1 MotA/TolQ/ExbB proton channel family protein [Desulfurivibrio alkaliphilus]
MDLATLIGVVLGSVLLMGAILLGDAPGIFFNPPSVLIVFGGTLATAMIRFSMADVINSAKIAMNAFTMRGNNPQEVIAEIVNLAHVARKNGLIVLEQQPITDPFLKKAIMYCVDGHEADFIEEVLQKEVDLTITRHQVGQQVFNGMGTSAPAFGMIGTLVGLVQMLSVMDDPASIGPGMAVALLTTLYGAVLANFLFIPIADKLALRSQEEEQNRQLIIEGVLGILKGLNPRVMEEFLETFLPPKDRKNAMAGR